MSIEFSAQHFASLYSATNLTTRKENFIAQSLFLRLLRPKLFTHRFLAPCFRNEIELNMAYWIDK